MNIIYIAYSCSPQNGTEDKLGWFIPFEASKTNNVWVITKPDSKKQIEEFQSEHNSKLNVVYCDVPEFYKKIYKGAFYSGRLNVWNKKIQSIVENICKENEIELIHQVNAVEFRSIGDFGRYAVPFVCGPVGGGEYMPKEVFKYALSGIDKEIIRFVANWYYKIKYIVSGRLKRVDLLLFVNEETRSFLFNKRNIANYQVMTELGSLKQNHSIKKQINGGSTIFMTAGRLIYRKGFNLLLDSIESVPQEYNFACFVVGDGPLKASLEKRVNSSELLKQRVKICGKVPFEKMSEYYQKADFFIMPSLRETTGSVILESMENGVPVITINKYGAKNLLNDKNSIMYEIDGNNPRDTLKDAIVKAIKMKDTFCSETIINMAEEFSFEKKNSLLMKLYSNLEKREKNHESNRCEL